jgi:hypothetical protein
MEHLNKVLAFIRSGVASSEPVATEKWRTLPVIARATGLSIEQVLDAVKTGKDQFVIRFGRHGDIYIARADNQGWFEGVEPGHGN